MTKHFLLSLYSFLQSADVRRVDERRKAGKNPFQPKCNVRLYYRTGTRNGIVPTGGNAMYGKQLWHSSLAYGLSSRKPTPEMKAFTDYCIKAMAT